MHPSVSCDTSLPAVPMNRLMRRALKSSRAEAAVPLLRDRAMTEAAHDGAVILMESRGNTLTKAHSEALYCVVGRITQLATGAMVGRYAYGLPAGGGKTTAIVAWCAAAHRLKRPYSVAICASKIEALCDLKRDMIAAGVPEAKIGLLHSFKHDPEEVAKAAAEGRSLRPGYASEPATEDNDSRPYLLVTHRRFRDGRNEEQYNRYNGNPRSVVIYDESLFVSDHWSVSKTDLKAGVSYWSVYLESSNDNTKKAALAYLRNAVELIDEELAAQKRGATPTKLHLPELDDTTLGQYIKSIDREYATRALKDLLSLSQEPLRVVPANLDGGLGAVTYEVVVPGELKRVAVLDASWPIRELERLDKSIKTDPAFNGNIKSYERVTIRQLRSSSGRGAIQKSFQEERRENRKVSLEVCRAIEAIPTTEAVLIFTFKPRGKVNIRETLEADLRAHGVNTRAKLPDGKPRFVWLAWGQETSISAYAYCQNVVLAGVLHRSDVDLSAAILGQRDDLLGNLPHQEIINVRRSEVAHCIYQAISRGSCRQTDNGRAHAMNVWLIHPELEVRDLIDRVMPGVRWEDWRGEYLTKRTGVIEETAEKIAGYLGGLPAEVSKVSTRTVKANLGLLVASRTFTHAVEAASNLAAFAWQFEGRSFVRCKADT